jgi:diguanylate cyclase (GGDEF)-like protein
MRRVCGVADQPGMRNHQRQLWLVAAVVVVAGLTGLSVIALDRQADRARLVQLSFQTLSVDVQHVSRIEWHVVAEGRLSAQLRQEFDALDRIIDRRLDAYVRAGSPGARSVDAQAHVYLAAVERQLALIGAGRRAESRRVDEREVDPAFDTLQQRFDRIDAAQGRHADTAASRSNVGVAASLALAAFSLIAMLWRLDVVRSAAGRERERDLAAMALHDALTGLPNRRKLLSDLDDAILRADAGSRCVLLLCDLDGFKAYNDNFGHMEGDLLLARLAAKLARTVADHGTAYRLGGDEFCALLRSDEQDLPSALQACHAALSESGSGFAIRASIGAVAIPAEAADAAAALRLADQRMYAHKTSRRSSTEQQLRDLIMRVHVECDPTLHEHVHDVARLAAGVGRELGMDDLEIADLVRAAELHDVGKIAIPDSILHKPGPLDADELEFMQRHTLIGENILGATSALSAVGRLVRSTHERYDGAGYPDGLRRDQIPLASRIVFVCDAFAAMTTDRPYRSRMSDDEALEELKHCGGAQFDPIVVEAFAAELTRLRAAQQQHAEERSRASPSLMA